MDNWHLTLGNCVSACAYFTYGCVIWANDAGGSRVRLLLRYSGVSLGPLDSVVTVHAADAPPLPPVTDHELIYEYARSYGFTVSPLKLLQAACFTGAIGSVYRVLTEISASRARAATASCLSISGGTSTLYVFEWVENAVVNACLCAAIYVLFGGLEEVTFVGVLVTAIFAELSGLLCEYLVVRGAPNQRQSNAAVGLSFYASVKVGVAALMFGGIVRLRSYQPLLYFVVLGTYVFYNCVYWVFSFQRTLGGLRNIEETEATYMSVGRAAYRDHVRSLVVVVLHGVFNLGAQPREVAAGGRIAVSERVGGALRRDAAPQSQRRVRVREPALDRRSRAARPSSVGLGLPLLLRQEGREGGDVGPHLDAGARAVERASEPAPHGRFFLLFLFLLPLLLLIAILHRHGLGRRLRADSRTRLEAMRAAAAAAAAAEVHVGGVAALRASGWQFECTAPGSVVVQNHVIGRRRRGLSGGGRLGRRATDAEQAAERLDRVD